MENPKRNRGARRGWPLAAPRKLIAALALAGATALPGVAWAQTGCGGAISIGTDPNTFPPDELLLTEVPLGDTVRVTLTPAKGIGTNDLTVAQVQYALTCTNNGDSVPCAGGNDAANSGGAPIAFAGNVDGTCGATNATTTDNGDGTVTFLFPPAVLDTAGCTVAFDVTVNDYGTDASPLNLTSAATTIGGFCSGGLLNGTARGSASIFVETVPDIKIVKEIRTDGGAWLDANDVGSAPTEVFPSDAEYRLTVTNTGTAPLTNVVVNDATLGIVDEPVGDLDPGEFVVLDSGDIPALFVVDRCTNSGEFTNTASTRGESVHTGAVVEDSDPAVLKCVGDPDISLLKQISVDGGATWADADAVGDADVPQVAFPSGAMYRFIVKNTGTAPLTNVTVSDPTVGIPPTLIADLAVNQEVIIDSGTFGFEDLDVAERCNSSGEFINTASVSAQSTETGDGVNDSNPAVLICVGTPNIDILKEISIDGGTTWHDANTEGAAPVAVFPHDAEYRLTVTNIGSAPLVNVVVNDATLGIVDHLIGDLAPGAFVVLTQVEISALFVDDRCTESGTISNVASTSGQSAETGTPVNDSDPAFMVCVGTPDIEIRKDISIDNGVTWFDANDAGSAPVAQAPSGALYRFVVTNTGTAPLVNVVVADLELGIPSTPIANLAVGESVIIGSGEIPALNVAERCDSAGEFTNVASVDAQSAETSEAVTDSDPAVLLCEGVDTCLTRTPGFWGTHPHVTVQFLDIEVCGNTIDNTGAGNGNSSAEAMCMSGRDAKKAGSNMSYLQLVRQLTAAKLNIAASATDGGTCDSVGGVNIDSLIERCELLCDASAKTIAASGCIEQLDAFNNSEDTLETFGPFIQPGPAAPAECQAANGNGIIVK
ncbi:MAG: hypothetical protein ACLGG1_06270 [Gammaproteobacteria bacterium]